jgi:hypothetical protein
MSELQLSPLKVTRAVLNCARAADFSFGEDTALVAVQHMLLQTVDLFETAAAMGLNLSNSFALGKVYSNSRPVIRNLRFLGVTVIESTTPAPGEFHSYFKRDVERLWQVALKTLEGRNVKRILVLDDAGLCITNVPAEVLRRYRVCGVEQTSQGVFLFEQKPPPFPVISWARSAIKLQIGGPIFSQCLLEKLNTDFLGGKSVRGETLGVIGLGSIGGALAKLAARQGFRVLFYDPLGGPSSSTTFERVESLEELMISCDYVVGCSGRQPFENKWPMKHRPGVKLLSASGGDHEFGPIINDLKAKPHFEVDPDTWTISVKNGPSGSLQIAYLGYPYNFVSRAPEAVPTQIVQLETAGLLMALVQACSYLRLEEGGPQYNHGLYRVAPDAQRFVFEKWLQAMGEQGVKLTEVFGYDEELLKLAQQDEWLAQHSHPPADGHDGLRTPWKNISRAKAQSRKGNF